MQKYTVQPGDTLYLIAKKLLGDGSRYMDFVKWNPYTIPDPNKISVGQTVLYVPVEGETQPAPDPVPIPSTGLKVPQPAPAKTMAKVMSRIPVSSKVIVAMAVGVGAAVILASRKTARS